MKQSDIAIFIEEMKNVGDIWTPEQVKRVYGKTTLKKAMEDRKLVLGIMGDILGKIISRE